MGLIVHWPNLAKHDLEKIYVFYEDQAGQRIAKKISRNIILASLSLEKNPYIGQKEENLSHRNKNFRYLVCENHKIIYWIHKEKDQIEIAGVFDCRQNPQKMNVIKEPSPKTYADKNEKTT